jgi:plastocyanin
MEYRMPGKLTGLGILIAFALGALVASRPVATTHIVLRPFGFSPKLVRVPQGTTITFINQTKKNMWPASNFHPTHTLYQEFDARAMVPPGQSWSFTFTRPGHWRYHDHLGPQIGGEITVYDPQTGSESACGPIAKTIFDKEACWAEKLEDSLKKDGVSAAFATLRNLYESEKEFQAACHDMTHFLGEATYRMISTGKRASVPDDVVSCGYGFYHGFIEALFFDGKKINDAFSYCRKFDSDAAPTAGEGSTLYSCFHGIGHGLFDSNASRFWGDAEAMVQSVIGNCSLINEGGKTAEAKKQCATGVFNALANGYSFQNYGLVFDAKDPLALCVAQQDADRRQACTTEMFLAYRSVKRFDEAGVVRFIHTLVAQDAQSATFAYVVDSVQKQISTINPGTIASWCTTFGDALRSACLEGILVALLERSTPGEEYKAGLAFCASGLLSQEEQESCYARELSIMASMYDRQTYADACKIVPQDYQYLCEN